MHLLDELETKYPVNTLFPFCIKFFASKGRGSTTGLLAYTREGSRICGPMDCPHKIPEGWKLSGMVRPYLKMYDTISSRLGSAGDVSCVTARLFSVHGHVSATSAYCTCEVVTW